ncbi:hypothetical protein F5Y15DRAFT_297227 [Xylariaceae sp. FL0016]|nr:hypothetical protein F5Y15DRAFT_297227 [Xylariaceae sp. FL0016]
MHPHQNQNEEYEPPPGPPPSKVRNNPFLSSNDGYVAPPPGPPPSHRRRAEAEEHEPPSGPPPSYAQRDDGFEPPPGPPPSKGKNNPFWSSNDDYTAPPPGPPPSHASYGASSSGQGQAQAQSQHDWQSAVPDTSLLPPPPAFFQSFESSPAHNASQSDSELGNAWCNKYREPLPDAVELPQNALAALPNDNINMMASKRYLGTLERSSMGVWRGRPREQQVKSRWPLKKAEKQVQEDTLICSYPPLYSAHEHSPLRTRTAKTIYYEVRLVEKECVPRVEVTLALGYYVHPYPLFRLPGWHKGSLGVHGDDGRKYVNNDEGGAKFVGPFVAGQTVGLGMEFSLGSGNRAIEVSVFFTREGKEEGRWDIHEELDIERRHQTVEGLEGFHDITAAVGVFEDVGFEVVFKREKWKWEGWRKPGVTL